MDKKKEKKEVGEFDIEIKNKALTITPAQPTHWYRDALVRGKQGILCTQILQDMTKIAFNLSKPSPQGYVGKYNFLSFNFDVNPKSSQGRKVSSYKESLAIELKKHASGMVPFKDKKLLLYVCVYLRKERFEKDDTDNFIKVIQDSLVPYVGDDKNIVSVIAEKKQLENYPDEDMDFLEKVVVLITDPAAKSDILK